MERLPCPPHFGNFGRRQTMFDFHMHSRVSFDGHDTGLALAKAAKEAGLQEICFTDHVDFDPLAVTQTMMFRVDEYNREYNDIEIPGLKIRKGMEFGLFPDNQSLLSQRIALRHFDYVLGSVHFAQNLDVYFNEYWQGKTVFEAQEKYLEQTLACVKAHDDFDVLAHMTFLCKAPANPVKAPMPYEAHPELIDEILKTLAEKGKGLEMNTSGIDRCGGSLPTRDFFLRFKQFGGEIVTVGSDAHRCDRVGQYCRKACQELSEIFGYVCTFEDRKPIFHRI